MFIENVTLRNNDDEIVASFEVEYRDIDAVADLVMYNGIIYHLEDYVARREEEGGGCENNYKQSLIVELNEEGKITRIVQNGEGWGE